MDADERREEETDRARGMDRRRFLDRSWKLLAVGLVAEAGWTTYDLLVPRASGGFGAVVEAGTESEVEEGVVRYFLGGRFYVTRVQGSLVALYQKCPHLGCRVPYCETSGRFECPCHGSVYNRKGEYLAGPAPRGMDSFPLTVENGRVLVDTGTVVEGPARGILTFREEPPGPSCLGGESGEHGEQAVARPAGDPGEAAE